MATSEPVASPKGGKRQQVMVGALPADFLRLQMPSTRQQQIEADAAAAQMLQQAEQWASYRPAVHHNIIGNLNVSVTQAKLTKNYGLTKMDPYCRIRMGHMVYETPTATNGAKNPRWNKSFLFKVPQGVESLYLEIYDERTFNQDERIAWAHITVPSSVFQGGDTIDDWYTLNGRQGDEKEGMINLVLTFTDISKMPVRPTPVVVPTAGGTYIMPYPGMAPGGYPVGPVPMSPHMPQMPMQQRQPEVAEADVAAVHELFPSMDMEVVRSVLEAHGGDQDASVNALLQMAEDPAAASQQHQQQPPPPSQAPESGVSR